MADDPGVDPPRAGGSGAQSWTPAVYVTDASAEATGITDTLGAAGYTVAEVALSNLVERAQLQRPHVVVVDVDAQGALEEVTRLRRLPGSGAIDFVFVGTGEG